MLPGVGDKLPPPNEFMQHLGDAPNSLAGKAGHFLEQGAEYAIPESKIAEAAKGASTLFRAAAHGLSSGAVAGVQSGGDPDATATAAVLGSAAVPAFQYGGDFLSYLGRKLNAPKWLSEISKAWKPTPTDSTFPDVTKEALSDVKTHGGVIDKASQPGEMKGDYNEHLQPADINPNSATEETIGKLQGGLNQWINRAENSGVKISGDGAVKAAYNAIPDRMKLEDPKQVIAILKKVDQAYSGKSFTPSQFRDFLRTGNASDSPFYNKSLAGQGTSELAGNPAAIDKAVTDWQREELYKALDPEQGGARPREIQERTGAVINLRNAAERRRGSINIEKPGTGLEGLGRIATGGLAFKAPVKGIIAPPVSLLHPFQGPTDALIERLFKHAPEGRPIPLPEGDYPLHNPQLRLPPPGTVAQGTPPINAAPGTAQTTVLNSSGQPIPAEGGLYDALTRRNLEPDVDQYKYSPRQLAESTYPSQGSEGTGGVSVPDIIGSSSRGEGTPHRLIADRPQPAVPTTGQIHITPQPADASYAQSFPAAHGSVATDPGLVHQYEVPHQQEIFTSETDALTVPKHLKDGLTLDKPREIRNAAGERYKIVLRKDGKVYEYKQ